MKQAVGWGVAPRRPHGHRDPAKCFSCGMVSHVFVHKCVRVSPTSPMTMDERKETIYFLLVKPDANANMLAND